MQFLGISVPAEFLLSIENHMKHRTNKTKAPHKKHSKDIAGNTHKKEN